MFKKLQLTVHLLTLYGVLVFFLLAVGSYALLVIDRYDETIHAVDREQFPLAHIVTEMTRHQLDQVLRFNEAMFYARISDREKFEVSNEKFVQAGKRFSDEVLEGRNVAQKAMDLAHSEARIKEIDAIKTLFKGIEKSHSDYEHLGASLIRSIYQYDFLSRSEGFTSADPMSGEEEANKHFATVKNLLSGLEDEVRRLEGGIKDVTERVKLLPQNVALDSERQRDRFFYRVLPMMGFAMAVGILLLFITVQVQKDREAQRYKLLTQSLDQLADSLQQLQITVEGSEPLSQQLFQVMGEQRPAVSRALKDMQQMVLDADSLHIYSGQMQDVVSQTVQGLQRMEGLIQSLHQDAERMLATESETGRALRQLKDTTLQINLLSTNASAEAMRSEATQPFAVYSDAIKELAHINLTMAESIANRTYDTIRRIQIDQERAEQTQDRFSQLVGLLSRERELFDKIVGMMQQQPILFREVQDMVSGVNGAFTLGMPLMEQVKSGWQVASIRLQEVREMLGNWPKGT
ncbi:methyl-accepting chemotaxis protein [Candidatus Magnetaquicoccus inordinatus]|uniref:methyl-accepting chemotaxis protein n=1 Tax=Candidatus Magnetaquicoccus inordinatus TaxID=2496818 RepID=UPI00102C588A|nr:methyl-accepting chemotaxis protein [Candidatus Magnetaquicoccus inordinatus]